MYAIFMTGGKQYKVSAGDVLRIEKINGDVGDKVKFDNVIAFSDADGKLQTGTPYLNAVVNATITDAGRGAKVIIFKFKAKKDYRRKQGHRQPFTEIEIDNFTVGGKKFGEKPAKPKEEKPKEEKPVKEKAPKEEKSKEEKPAKEKAPKEEKPKDEKPAKEKAPKEEKPKEEKPAREKAPKEEKPVKEKAPKEEKPKEEKPAKEKAPKAEEVDLTKLTKADLSAKLDELGVKYLKSAKKEELIELLKNAGKK